MSARERGEVYLSIDIGASSGRHIVSYLEGGKLRLTEVYRFPNGVEKREGRLYWNEKKLFSEIVKGLKAAKEKGFEPSYVGIDTWAVDYALLDEKDDPIGGVYAYRDGRGAAIKDEAHAILPFEALYRKTGIQYAPFNTLYQLADDKKTGRLKGAKSFLMLPDYFNFLLSGVKKQEYTNATSTGMVNALSHVWDEEILSAFGFPKELFRSLSQPGAIVGKVKGEITKEIGYEPTVLLPATHDTASAVLAAPVSDGSPYLSSGTWSLLGLEVPAAKTEEIAMRRNYSNEGGLNATFRLQKNIIGLWIVQEIRKELEADYSFADLVALAESDPTDATFDVFDEIFLSPESMLAAVQSRVGKLSLGKVLFAVFNSLAKGYAAALRELSEISGKTFDTLHIIGGGCQNELLSRLTAKATGKKVVAGPVEATAIGNAVMQLIATGEIEDLSAAREIVRNSFEVKEIL